ncbi:MAG TPA: methyltransferase domain-containing protein [Ktedonobacterales bacterium]
MQHIHPSQPETEGSVIHWAAHYDLLVQVLTLGRSRRLRARTADRAQAQPGDAVLDVGCGTGALALVLARRVGPTGKVAGIDASPEMIAQAQKKASKRGLSIDFRLEPVEAMSFPDQTFDCATSSLMYHHLPGDLKRQAVESIARVLKPGGRLVIVDYTQKLPGHRARPSGIEDAPALLRAAGFTDITSSPLGFLSLVCVSARKPIHQG